jgi:hypothetical protein
LPDDNTFQTERISNETVFMVFDDDLQRFHKANLSRETLSVKRDCRDEAFASSTVWKFKGHGTKEILRFAVHEPQCPKRSRGTEAFSG